MTLKLTVALYTAVILAAVCCVRAQDQPAPIPQDSASPVPVYKIGSGVTPPRVIQQADPEFSEQARKKNFQGTCVLSLVVSEDGMPRNIRITEPLGMGLDEKAVEAVRSWKFDPARKDGKPVAVEIRVEVDFHLYLKNDAKIAELIRKADSGDDKAELELSTFYFEGREVGKDDDRGMMYLRRAARHGFPKAQFLMGEHLAQSEQDYPKAYMWYTIAKRSGYKHCDKKLKELTAKMTSEQVREGQELAEKWPNVFSAK
jgi:TonB family protein